MTVVDLFSLNAFGILPSEERTEDPDAILFQGIDDHVGLIVVVDATAVADGGSLTVAIKGGVGEYVLLASAAIEEAGTTVLKIRPGITAAANAAVADALPPVFEVSATHATEDTITYSISGYLTH